MFINLYHAHNGHGKKTNFPAKRPLTAHALIPVSIMEKLLFRSISCAPDLDTSS